MQRQLWADGSILISSSIISNVLRNQGNGAPITIYGRAIAITDSSEIFAYTGGIGDAGRITLRATDQIEIGQGSQVSVGVNSGAQGDGGRITIRTPELQVRDEGRIFTFTAGMGDAGVLDIHASQEVFIGGRSVLAAGVSSTATGNGGSILIRTSQLTAEDSAIRTDTEANGTGGDLVIQASDTLTISGTVEQNQASSVISSTTSGPYRAGNITLRARQLTIRGTWFSSETWGSGQGGHLRFDIEEDFAFTGGGVISASALSGSGQGGNIQINTGSLLVTNQGQIASGSFSAGNSGQIKVQANRVRLVGDPGADTRVGLFTQSQSSGRAGALQISTERLDIERGAVISVSGIATGEPGSLSIAADMLVLDQGTLEARTISGGGANILLSINDYLLLRDNSQIVAEALGTGNGGNIQIESPFILGALNENSDISANAFEGAGGRVEITAQSIIGLTPRSRDELTSLLGTNEPELLDPQRLPTNDITAISQANPTLSGVVTITTPDTDPNRGTAELPAELLDASNLVTQSCRGGAIASNRLGEFTVTGRGGLPPSPDGLLSPEALQTSWVVLSERTESRAAPAMTAGDNVVEAQAWTNTAQGAIRLVAEPTNPLTLEQGRFCRH